MQHHTKEKGDLAVAMVIADMKKNGIGLALPLSEHMPFDLIAIDTANGYALRKVQVKYATCLNGKIAFNLRTSYADRHGSHVKPVDRSTFDAYAIYCPDTDLVYYVNNYEIPPAMDTVISLRIAESKNGQTTGIRWSKDYLGIRRIFR
jgi:hypothetical protein